MRFSIASSPCSWITWAIVKTLEIDWIDTSVLMSPGGVDLAVGGDHGDAEQVRIDLGQGGDVVGVLAFLQPLELGVGGVHRGLDVRSGLRVERRDRLGDEREREHAGAEARRGRG
jgi:hypothetical protein